MSVQTRPVAMSTAVQRPGPRGSALLSAFSTAGHKRIGVLYLVASFGFFLVAGVMALLMRAELGQSSLQFLSQEQYNQLFTMHGTVMLLLYATPTLFGSRIWCCRCRSGHRMSRFPASTHCPTGCSCSAG